MEAIRLGRFKDGELIQADQVLLRRIPNTPYSVGQVTRGRLPDEEFISALKELAVEKKIIHIKLEPEYIVRRWPNKKGKIKKKQVEKNLINLEKLDLKPAQHTLFAKHTFSIDLTESEEDLMMNMHRKTRYNTRLAEKKGVKILEESTKKGLDLFNNLLQKTLKRQEFYMHSPAYFEKLWRHLSADNISRILLARYKNEVLSAWMIFKWKDKIYYPYGASSSKHREVMASNLICWETIRKGKEWGCKSFDMMGALGPEADKNDPWYGFHRFKRGYGGDLIEFAGSWDLINSPLLYQGVQAANKIRWAYLNLKQKLPF